MAKPSDNHQSHKLTEKMLERMALFQNERMMFNMLTFDDFNYVAFNKKLLELNIDLDSINIDKEERTSLSDNSFFFAESDDENLKSLERLQSATSDEEGYLNSPLNSKDDKIARKNTQMKLFSSKQKKDLKSAQHIDPFGGIIQTKTKENAVAKSSMINITHEWHKLQYNEKKIVDVKKKSHKKKVVIMIEKDKKLNTQKTLKT